MPASYSTHIDWNGDGGYSDTGEDVSARVLPEAMTIEYGRDTARAMAPVSPGSMDLGLSNRDRALYPDNTSSPIVVAHGAIMPARPIRQQATLSAVTYTLFRGRTDGYDPFVPGRGLGTVSIKATDALGALQDVPISTDLHQGIRTGTAIGLILDAAGWPADKRDLDPGATIMPYWWGEGDAWAELMKVVNSEGPPSLVTSDPDGNFVFRDRHHRLQRAASTASQATFRASGADPRFSWPLEYEHGMSAVINTVTFSVDERALSRELSDVWTSEGLVYVPAGATKVLKIRTDDPFLGAVVPEAGIDYEIVSGSPSFSTSRGAGRSITLFIAAGGSAALIRDVKLRAYALTVRRTVQITVEDTNSIGKYGPKSMTESLAPVWASAYDAEAIGQIIVGHRSERKPMVIVKFVGGNNITILTQQLVRKLSDRVTIVDSLETGLNAPFHIENIRHVLRGSGERIHETYFGCEMAPAQPANIFRFDDAAAGFNNGVFGQIGLDDPATIFTFDDPARGFDNGQFAT
jgi:hypothetical protein